MFVILFECTIELSMFDNLKLFMNKNREIFVGVSTVLIILLLVLIGLTFDQNNKLENLATVRRGSGSDEHGRCNYNLNCTANKSTTNINEEVEFVANIQNVNEYCHGEPEYTWKNFSMSVSDGFPYSTSTTSGGIHLVASVNYNGTYRNDTCNHVYIEPPTPLTPMSYFDGSESHTCRLLFVNGYNSDNYEMSFSDAAKLYIVDGAQIGSGERGGEGEKYNTIRVRSLIPRNTTITSNDPVANELAIKNQVESWISQNNAGGHSYTVDPTGGIEKGIIIAHSLGTVSSVNYKNDYPQPQYPELYYYLYDGPYAWQTRAPGYIIERHGAWIAQHWPFSWPEGLVLAQQIEKAKGYGLQDELVADWTNGLNLNDYAALYTNPLEKMGEDHGQYRNNPAVLGHISNALSAQCEYLYFPKL